MENPRYVKGELSTHFIEQETTLLDDMKVIIEREKPLEERLGTIFDDKKKVAAFAAVAAVNQLISGRIAKDE